MDHASVFENFGRFVERRRRPVLLVALVGVVLAIAWGTGVIGQLQTAGGFTAPNSQSQQAGDLASRAFGRDAGDVVVLYSSRAQTVSSPAFRAAVVGTLDALPRRDVLSSATYWSTGAAHFASAGGHQTFAVLEMRGADDAARQKSYDAIASRLAAPGVQTRREWAA